jgi:sialic acid synthase SpsE
MKNSFFNKKKTFIIAEIGNNHEGSLKNAFRLIDEAAKAKVDAIKFQTFDTNLFIHPSEQLSYQKFKKFQFSKNDFVKLFKYVKKKKLYLASTPFDIKSAIFLKEYIDIFKIASGDNNFYDLINLVINFKKPTLISNGFLSITESLNLIKRIKSLNKNICLLHCVASYPVKNYCASLLNIKKLIAKSKIPIGYSDHTVGTTASLLAVALGAKVIEKHFTLSNNFSLFRDHKLSLNPKDMSFLVEEIRKADEMLKYKTEKFIDNEENIYPFARRSLYFRNAVKKGQFIKKNDLIFLRPFKKENSKNLKKVNSRASKSFLKYDLF